MWLLCFSHVYQATLWGVLLLYFISICTVDVIILFIDDSVRTHSSPSNLPLANRIVYSVLLSHVVRCRVGWHLWSASNPSLFEPVQFCVCWFAHFDLWIIVAIFHVSSRSGLVFCLRTPCSILWPINDSSQTLLSLSFQHEPIMMLHFK